MPSARIARWSIAAWLAGAVAGTAAPACAGGGDDRPDGGLSGPVMLDLAAPPPQRLSAYHLFTWSAAAGFAFNDRVVPYELNTALFSDYALKQRAIYVPEGAAAAFDPEQAFSFPVGSVIVKNFYFPTDFRAPTAGLRMIETRLMVRHPDGWHPLPYIWDADQRDAVLSPSGEVRPISFIDASGTAQTANYLIPERNQCQGCHARQADPASPIEIVLIGIKARHLNRSYDYGGDVGPRNQLERLGLLGMLDGAAAATAVPAAYDFRPIEATGPAALAPAALDAAARAYLDINCAHCHNPQGIQGATSQLFLNHDNTDLFHLGACKRPGSAGAGNGGLVFDIVPGSPDSSILYFRTHTQQVGAIMPLLNRSLTHVRGTELLHTWIAAMPADDCQAQ
jgi:uncharacterized repeat protein (TIGR03806 family)